MQAQVSFQQPLTFTDCSSGIFAKLFAADFNGDGKPDLLCFDGTLNLGNGDGRFKTGVSYSLGSAGYDSALSVSDFNGDGKLDVAVYTASQVLVFFGNGDGTLQAPKISAGPTYNLDMYNSFSIVSGDLNGDGKPDVVIGAGCLSQVFQATVYTLLGNGDGTFQTPQATTSNSLPFVVLDANGDGKADLASASTPTIAQISLGIFLMSNNYFLDSGFEAASRGIL